MAITVKEAQTLYVSYFGRPADFVGLQYWTGTETLVGSLEQLAHSFYNSAEGKKYFPVDPATNQIDVTASINAIYANMFGRVPETAGFDYWYNEIASGKINPAEAAVAIYRGAQGKDALMIENKIAAATQFTDQVAASDKPSLYYGDQAFAKANEFLNTVTDVTDVTSAGFAAQVNAAVNAAEAAGGASSSEGGIFTLATDKNGLPLDGTLTNEANVNFDVPEGQSRYLTAGNDVIDLSKWNGTKSVNIGDAFSGDNDKVTVMANGLAGTGVNNLTLTSIENLEIVNSGVKTPVTLGAKLKGLEAIKLIGDATTLDVSSFTQGVKIDATANADTITGSDKADTINGGAGNDVITGNGGVDILTGGNGADEFVVGTVRDAGVDQILDFSAEDKITMKGFSAKELKKFDASTFSTVTYKTLDSVLATFATGGANVTKAGDVVIFSYNGKTYALLATDTGFKEANDALVDITGANVASLTESNFGVSGAFANYADFKAAVGSGEVTTDSPTTIKSITVDEANALLTTDKDYLKYIDNDGIGAVTGGIVRVGMNDKILNATEFADKLATSVVLNIKGVTTGGNNITSPFAGSITGGSGNGSPIDDTIDASKAIGAVTIDGSGGADSITGGSGADNITGGDGADTIIGEAGNDTIIGGEGQDSIKGGAGNDEINLSETAAASDIIVFESIASANGQDTITGFTAGSTSGDKLNFTGFAGAASGKFVTGAKASADLSSKTYAVINDANSLTDADIAGLKNIAANQKYVIIAATESDTSGAGTIYYVTTGTNFQASQTTDLTVETVGTIKHTNAAFVEGNFA